MLSPFNFTKINISVQRTLLLGCTLHYNVSSTKPFQLNAGMLFLKSTYKHSCALYRHYLSMKSFFFDGEHNLKSKPQIVYALWLPTVFWLCPRDTQLHQTGETNRISCKQSVCSCCVVEYPQLVELEILCVWVCVKWKVMNENWCSLVFPDSNTGGLHL